MTHWPDPLRDVHDAAEAARDPAGAVVRAIRRGDRVLFGHNFQDGPRGWACVDCGRAIDDCQDMCPRSEGS